MTENISVGGHAYRLLIVEDDVVDRQNYSRLLTRRLPSTCEIRHAANGASGLSELCASVPDCILLDFNLPDMTGLEFLADASDGGELPCAVVLVTGHGNEAIAVEAMKRGVQDYLVKDQVNASSLWRAITTAVTQVELRKRLAQSLRDLTATKQSLEREAAVREAAERDLRAAKDAAEQASQAKTRFVAMVTHELRTPLNGLLGYAELLRIEGDLSERQKAHVDAMMRAGRHLLDMIERVLDFASIETGRLELHPVAMSVSELSEACIGFIGPMAAQHALDLRLVTSHDAPRQIVSDPPRLRQVILNLLGNAVKYTKVGSIELRVLSGATPGALRIEVADTGPGINEPDRSCLFKDFERLGATTSVEGAGLGLAIAARIVTAMHGAIGHSVNPNGGSVFWLELSASDTDIVLASPSSDARPPTARDGRRILLIDDVAMNRDVIGAFLRAGGHDVRVAGGGREAVRLASEQEFDLILMDVRMPEIDGMEATRLIRASPHPHGCVPILALTAHTFPDEIAIFRGAGMNGHIGKPVDFETLMRAVADATACRAPWPSDKAVEFSPAAIECRSSGSAADTRPLPCLDRAVFDETLAFLPTDTIETHLAGFRARAGLMLCHLDDGTAPALLREISHNMASAAGMFGFVALSAASHSFEHAVEQNARDASRLASGVRDAIRAAVVAFDNLTRELRLP